MEYQALYRRYRPVTFGQMVGQDHVTTTLVRELQEGKVAHAYLFAGPRGTGKTTTARILAKALNCPNVTEEKEPCNECPSCEAVIEGTSLDIIELDAASHNKVEDIREMRVSVSTVAAMGGGKRVFILDEAHMLTKAAGNALLKTLEEPPEHVHFVLATTEPYKLLDTIRSRTQRFDFRPVPIEVLADYMAVLAEREEIGVGDGALTALARHAGGSVRDALSLMEQVAALGDSTVDLSGVARALGLAPRETFRRLSTAIAEQDARAAMELASELAASGADLRRFVSDAISFYRGVFLTHYAPNVAEITDESEETIEEWTIVASQLPAPMVLRVVDHLTEALVKLREGREERLMVELTLLKLTRPEVALDPESLVMRLDQMEERLRAVQRNALQAPTAQVPAAAAPVAPEPSADPKPAAPVVDEPEVSKEAIETSPAPTEAAEEAAAPDAVFEDAPGATAAAATHVPPAEGLTLARFEEIWPMLFSRTRDVLSPRQQATFREAIPGGVDGSTLVLYVPEHLEFHLQQLQASPEIGAVVATHAAELLGGSVEVRFTSAPEERAAPADDTVEMPDKNALVEAPASVTDPTSLVQDIIGAEVVEESS